MQISNLSNIFKKNVFLDKYLLKKNFKVLDLGCKKGFLLKDLNILIPGIKSYGIENHSYALKKAVKCKSKLIKSEYYNMPFKNKYFDFVIAFNSLYMQNLGDVIKSLKEIERVSKKSYIVLASGENDQERNKFYRWTLIGTTILSKKEWKTLFKKLKFQGDYYFSSAKSLVSCSICFSCASFNFACFFASFFFCLLVVIFGWAASLSF